MSARGITRRSLLSAGAGVVAGSVMRPGGAIATLLGPPPAALASQWVGSVPAAGRTIALARSADLIAVQWQAPAAARIELRFRSGGGGWSGWVSAAGCCGGPIPAGAPADGLIGAPLWTGGTTTVQLRAGQGLSGVRLRLVDVSGGMGASREARVMASLASASLPAAAPVLNAGPGQPPIIARRAWAQGMARPRVVPGYGAVRMAFVHHTENPNGYARAEVPAMLRAIYAFHRYVNGWNDIGYNFVVDRFGRIFEARAGGIDEPVVGAHAGGYNLVSTGVAVLGSFMGAPISPAARRSVERLLAWKLSLHGVPPAGRVTVRVNPAGAVYSRFPAGAHVSLPRIAGHRDADSTDCPGNVLYGELPGLRPRVRRLSARAARAKLVLAPPAPVAPPAAGAPPSPPPPTVTPPPPPAGTGGESRTLAGTLQRLDGTPLAGARIMLQARTASRRGELVQERTIGEALTDAQGRWSLAVTLVPAAKGSSLRALCAGSGASGATVSEPLDLPSAVSLTPPAPPPRVPEPTGPPAPAPSPPAAAPPAP
jgi:hypothetical protein